MLSADSVIGDDGFCGLIEALRRWKYASENYSYLGVNFRGDNISSIKFYYTFLGSHLFLDDFPIPEIAEKFHSYREELSGHHINTPLLPGCGITFTIKYKENGDASRGVYFRVRCDAKKYIERFLGKIGYPVNYYNRFDGSGVLKYLEIDASGVVRERNYIYCHDCVFLDDFDDCSGVLFSKSDCLEISTDWDDGKLDNMKFIGLSQAPLVQKKTRLETAKIVSVCQAAGFVVGPWSALYGYYLHKDIKSVFLFGREKGKGSVLPRAMRVDEEVE